MTVDTLEIAKELESAGMARPHAEAVSHVVGRLAYDELVTRDHLDTRISELRGHLDGRISDLRAELFRLLFGAVTIIIAAMALLRSWPS